MMATLFTRALPWLLLAALALAGLQTYRLAIEQRDHAGAVRDHALEIADLEKRGREALQAARDESTRRFMALWEITDETQIKLAAATADADSAADAGQRLRRSLAALTAARHDPACSDTAPAGGSAPADTTADLLADVQRRLDQAADGIARHADQAYIAGAACEASYDTLKNPLDARP